MRRTVVPVVFLGGTTWSTKQWMEIEEGEFVGNWK